MFVDMLKGKTIEEACQIKDKDIAEALELPPIKLHCSVLAEDSIKQAITQLATPHQKENIMNWFENKTTQLIALAGISELLQGLDTPVLHTLIE